MSEQQPLLSSEQDLESASPHSKDSRLTRWRVKTGEILESGLVHKTIIALIVVDGAIVLSDLGYTFLTPGCEPEGEGPLWLQIFEIISIVITSLFILEIPAELWAFGLDFFNPFGKTTHAVLHLLDAFIIITTFILEVVLRGKERELAELLILLRLWRLVKLVGGLAVGAGEIEEETVKELEGAKQQLSELRQENQSLRERVEALERRSRQ